MLFYLNVPWGLPKSNLNTRDRECWIKNNEGLCVIYVAELGVNERFCLSHFLWVLNSRVIEIHIIFQGPG